MKRPEVHFQSRHESGNTLYILGLVRNALQKEHRITEYNDLCDAVFSAGSYEEALRLMNQHVTLIDDDEYYDLNQGI